MHPELTLITQNKNLALTFAETGFAMSSVPILAQHKLHAVAEEVTEKVFLFYISNKEDTMLQ